jgi:hypothetical protein
MDQGIVARKPEAKHVVLHAVPPWRRDRLSSVLDRLQQRRGEDCEREGARIRKEHAACGGMRGTASAGVFYEHYLRIALAAAGDMIDACIRFGASNKDESVTWFVAHDAETFVAGLMSDHLEKYGVVARGDGRAFARMLRPRGFDFRAEVRLRYAVRPADWKRWRVVARVLSLAWQARRMLGLPL